MMDFGYPIRMFCFTGALLFYSVLLVRTKNISLIPQADKARIQDKQAYTKQFGKAVAVISLAPAVSGILWLTGAVRRSIAFLVLAFILCVWEATNIVSKAE